MHHIHGLNDRACFNYISNLNAVHSSVWQCKIPPIPHPNNSMSSISEILFRDNIPLCVRWFEKPPDCNAVCKIAFTVGLDASRFNKTRNVYQAIVTCGSETRKHSPVSHQSRHKPIRLFYLHFVRLKDKYTILTQRYIDYNNYKWPRCNNWRSQPCRSSIYTHTRSIQSYQTYARFATRDSNISTSMFNHSF